LILNSEEQLKSITMKRLNPKMLFVMAVWIIVYWICLSYLPKFMTFIEIDHKPIASPPWYFILSDLRQSIAAFIGFILSMALLIFYYRKVDFNYIFLLFFSLIGYGNDIGNGISIFINTTNVFNSELATTNWENLIDYLDSSWKSNLFYIYIVLISISYLFILIKIKKNKPNIA